MKEIALYIHIPFCKQKCLYCDFPSYASKESMMDEYIEALTKEIGDKAKNYIIKSVFIGGGTPSYLNKEGLLKLMEALKKLQYVNGAEITMECNPGTVDEEKFNIMKNGGINRLSFGLQTTKDSLLKKIGRIHSYSKFKENYYLARKCGFDNINVDMMFGLPDQTLQDWIDSLEEIISIKPEHISAYSLIIEEGTPFWKMYNEDKLNLPEENEERMMYEEGKKILEKHGYNQYEISNYSLTGRECIHNEEYWKCNEYLGVGASASGFVDNVRYKNIDSLSEYIKRINSNSEVIEEEIKNSLKDNIEEFMFMGLRMNCGINEEEFKRRFSKNVDDIYEEVIKINVERELLKRNNGRIYLTDKGMELSNVVMSDMIL